MEIQQESLRIIANVNQLYDAWMAARRERLSLPSTMVWKNINNARYLYRIEQNGTQKSMGRESDETHRSYADFLSRREELDKRIADTAVNLNQYLVQYRALRLPQLLDLPGKILRELDLRSMLGIDFIVVGTNAFPVYEIEARERFARGLDETEDFDLAWCRGGQISLQSTGQDRAIGSPLLSVLKNIDGSFAINREKPYQALNSKGYEVELLAAPSVMRTMSADEVFSTAAMPEQEWLLLGRPVRHIVCSRTGEPVPIVAPDPRYMALHKLWLSKKETRRADKKDKDRKQGDLLLVAVTRKMQDSYPVDADFVLGLPEELLPVFNEWAEAHKYIPPSKSVPGWAN